WGRGAVPAGAASPPAGAASPPAPQAGQRATSPEGGRLAQVVLDAQQLVVLGDAVGPRRRAGLDLAAVGGDGQVGDRRVLGLAGAVAHHAAVAVLLREAHRVEGLRERPDLVDLDEQGVRGAPLDALLEPLDVGDEEVVAD